MYIDRLVLLFIAAAYVLSPALMQWWAESGAAWWRPFLVWGLPGSTNDPTSDPRFAHALIGMLAGPAVTGVVLWGVANVLAGLEETLRQRAACTVGSLDRPHPVRPRLHVGPHRGVAGLVGSEPASAEELLVLVDDLDRGRQLVGIDPDDHVLHVLLPPVLDPTWTARWALLLRAGQSPLEPRLDTAPGGERKPIESHTHIAEVGSREESLPPSTWTESGRTPVLLRDCA